MVALCISVVSFPLMLDRHAGAGEAMVTSLRAVAKNPVPMAAWGLIVAVLLVLGSLPFFLGLAVVIPLLGHATWHLYRKVIATGSQCAADPAPPAARTALGSGFPGQLVSVAAQGRRIEPQRIGNCRQTAGRSSTGGFACEVRASAHERSHSHVLAAVAVDISRRRSSLLRMRIDPRLMTPMTLRPLSEHSPERCPDAAAHAPALAAPAAPAAFEAWLDDFKTEAAAKGISQAAIACRPERRDAGSGRAVARSLAEGVQPEF